ncbi:hypothetical protein J5X84_41190 [Streptosporangiaceae bacterium NEAU-GS5]|nr:hypothetical protein [Streptosporangiaceae bacterium NEAU-GS5]
MLFAQQRETDSFFKRLAQEPIEEDAAENIVEIIDEFFKRARSEATVGEVAQVGLGQAGSRSKDGLTVALQQLAQVADVPEVALWGAAKTVLPKRQDIQARGAADCLRVTVPSPLNRVVVATALFLAAWEHVLEVDGQACKQAIGAAKLFVREFPPGFEILADELDQIDAR